MAGGAARLGRRQPARPVTVKQGVAPRYGWDRHVQSASQSFTTSATPRAVAYPAAVRAGNLLVVVVATWQTAITVTLSDALGQTYTQAGSYVVNSSTRLSIWYKANTAGGANTVTVTQSATAYVALAVAEYTGMDQSSPLRAVATGTTGNSTAPLTGAVTSAADDVVVGAFAADTGRTDTVALPFVLHRTVTNTSFVGMSFASVLATGVSSGPAAFTHSSSDAWAALAVSFKPAAAAGGGGPRRRRILTRTV